MKFPKNAIVAFLVGSTLWATSALAQPADAPSTVGATYRAASATEVLKHAARLWGFGVHLESTNGKGDVTKRWTVNPAPQ